MKKFFPILMVVALTAGCGSGLINADCEESFESFCDGSILYQVDLCGNSVALGQCEYGCNLEFSGCQAFKIAGSPKPVESANTFATAANYEQMNSAEFQDLPQIDPYDR